MRSSKFVFFVFVVALFFVVCPTSRAATISPSVFIRTLKLGSTGADVRALQVFLNTHGFVIARTGVGSPGRETSYFGSATKNAVARYQQAHYESVIRRAGLTRATGLFGNYTKTAVVNTLNTEIATGDPAPLPYTPPQEDNDLVFLPAPVPPQSSQLSVVGILPGSAEAKDVIVRVAPLDPQVPAVTGTLAYIANAPWGLSVVDVSTATAPAILGTVPIPFAGTSMSMNNSGQLIAIEGTKEIFKNGAKTTLNFCDLVNVSNPRHPLIVGKIENFGERCISPFISNNTLYVARGVHGVAIYDISDPSEPALQGTYDTAEFSTDITVDGNFAYVADGIGGLVILNVSDPDSPTFVTKFATVGNAQRVTIHGNLAYVADGSAISVIDLKNKSYPMNGGILVSPPTQVTRYNISGGRTAVKMRFGTGQDSNLLYLAIGGGGLMTLDTTNSAMIPRGSLAPSGGPTASTQSIDVLNNIAYIANFGGGLAIATGANTANPVKVKAVGEWFTAKKIATKSGLAIISGTKYSENGTNSKNALRFANLTNPTNPIIIKDIETTLYSFLDLTIDGDYAYIAAGLDGLLIYDIHDTNNPQFVRSFSTPGFASSVAVVGGFAYVAAGAQGMHIIDVGNPAAPTLISSLNTPGTASHIAVDGNRAYIADGGSVIVVDTTTKSNVCVYGTTNPVVRSTPDTTTPCTTGGRYTLAFGDTATQVRVQNNIAYVATARAGLTILDASDLARFSSLANPRPALLKKVAPSGGPNASTMAVVLDGSYAYTANFDGGIAKIDVTNPATAAQVDIAFGAKEIVALATLRDNQNHIYLVGADTLAGLIVADPTFIPANDNTGPELVITYPVLDGNDEGNTTVDTLVLRGTVSDPSTISRIEVAVNGESPFNATYPLTYPSEWNYPTAWTAQISSPLQRGPNTITITATDNNPAHNVTSREFTLNYNLPPTTPTDLSARVITASQVNLSWSASTNGAGTIGYKVFRNGSPISTLNATSYTDANLTPCTTYTHTVGAFDSAGGFSDYSDEVKTTTVMPLPIPAPTLLTGTPETGNRIALSWSPVSDPNQCAPIYAIYRNGSEVGTTQSTTYIDGTFTSPIPVGIYKYTVKAFEQPFGASARLNISPFSNEKLVTTLTGTINKFLLSQEVKATSLVHVRSTPGGLSIGQVPSGTIGYVEAGPSRTDDAQTWWQINWVEPINGMETLFRGWVSEDYMTGTTRPDYQRN